MDANVKRDILRKIILELLSKGCVHYTDLDKKICATAYSFTTTNTFKSQLHYLLSNGCIARTRRGVYKITDKGEKYLALLAT
jgi:predicted transcriptional regulator